MKKCPSDHHASLLTPAIRSQPLSPSDRILFLLQVAASCCCRPCPIPHSRMVANEVSYYNGGHRPELFPVNFDLLLHICSLSHEFCYVGGEQLLILKFHHMIFCLWMLHQFLILKHQCLSIDFSVLGGCTVRSACVFILCSEQKINYKIVSWKVHVHLLRWF